MAKPVKFNYIPEDYSTWTDKTTIENDNGVFTKKTVKTFIMDDDEEFVQTQSETKDFNIPNQPFEYDFDNSDILTNWNVSRGPTDQSVLMLGNIT